MMHWNQKRLAVLLLAMNGCAAAAHEDVTPQAKDSGGRTEILKSMPTNSDKRCVGIALVAEALLEGLGSETHAAIEANRLADQIYGSLTAKGPVARHDQIIVGGVAMDIADRAALEELSTLVADRYKGDFLRLSGTDAGRRRLLDAEQNTISAEGELKRILAADGDQTDVFVGLGSRRFPDGTIQETHHAFLLSRDQRGSILVYDPNDPGLALDCKVDEADGHLWVEWTCIYRETGKRTTQRYRVVHKDSYFQVMLGQ